jgi:hypothetical protein
MSGQAVQPNGTTSDVPLERVASTDPLESLLDSIDKSIREALDRACLGDKAERPLRDDSTADVQCFCQHEPRSERAQPTM